MLGIYVFEFDEANWRKKCVNFEMVEFVPQNTIKIELSLKHVDRRGFIVMPVTYGPGVKGPFLIMCKCRENFRFEEVKGGGGEGKE